MGLAPRKSGCFVIGSGPSLRATDVTRLSDLDTIAFNRSYVAWEQWGFAPTFYACLDPIVFEDNAAEVHSLIAEHHRTTFFLPDGAESAGIRLSAQVSHVSLTVGSTFSNDLSTLTDFGNVGATSFQILALLGYRRIGMVGVDARYRPLEDLPSVGKDEFVLVDDDPNHFCPEYVRGKRLRARPDVSRVLGQWPQVADECTRRGIDVRNASVGSALDCFPKTDFASAIEWVRGVDL